MEVKDNIAILTIDHPPANALSSEIILKIDQSLDQIEKQKKIKVVVIIGKGKFFSAGADITEFTDLKNEKKFKTMAERAQQLFHRIEQFQVPVIAAIHGAALGGGLELAMSCHMRMVTEGAKIGMPELTLGLIPGFAGTQRLPQLIGVSKAYDLLLTGESISGKEAYLIGLATRVVNEGKLKEEVLNFANQIASKSKNSIKEIMRLTTYAKKGDYGIGMKEEMESFANIFATNDAKEGILAFKEKRKPLFQDDE